MSTISIELTEREISQLRYMMDQKLVREYFNNSGGAIKRIKNKVNKALSEEKDIWRPKDL